MITDNHEISLIEELESELITASAELAAACLQPLTGRTAQRVVALAAQITGTVAKVL
jgi:capsule polysaccharide export protein KpsE/RkpR